MRTEKSHLGRQRSSYFLIVLLVVSFTVSCGKRVDPAPKPQAPPPFEFIDAWGEKGEGPGKLSGPVAFAIDSQDRVFFADPGSGFVHKFETNGTPLLSFEDTRLARASGIAVDSGGAIYVADAVRGSILIFFPDGTFLRALHTTPQPHFSGPLGISVDIAGNVYVPDPAGSRIMKFDDHSRLVKSWKVPQNAPQNAPRDTPQIAPSPDERPSSTATSQDGSVFVAYAGTGRIEKYSSDGLWTTSWNATENVGEGSRAISGLAVAGLYVFTMDAMPPRIRVWTLDGQHKLDDSLTGHLDSVIAPQIVVTPHQELLVFAPSVPRVIRFRIHL